MALRRAAASLVQRLSGVAEESLFASAKQWETATCNAEAVRNASNQAVKMRIRAIKNIGKITKAMKMVAASKMRAAQIVDPFYRLFGDYPGMCHRNINAHQ